MKRSIDFGVGVGIAAILVLCGCGGSTPKRASDSQPDGPGIPPQAQPAEYRAPQQGAQLLGGALVVEHSFLNTATGQCQLTLKNASDARVERLVWIRWYDGQDRYIRRGRENSQKLSLEPGQQATIKATSPAPGYRSWSVVLAGQ